MKSIGYILFFREILNNAIIIKRLHLVMFQTRASFFVIYPFEGAR
ncbi:hypothetical protein [Bacillus sp. ISL-34]|nr:hypothetical protein [Bacillus sp. ISL-34]